MEAANDEQSMTKDYEWVKQVMSRLSLLPIGMLDEKESP